MADNKVAFVALLLIAGLLLLAGRAAADPGCIQDCVNRYSNGKNLISCSTMCAAACVKSGGDAAKAAKTAADPYFDP